MVQLPSLLDLSLGSCRISEVGTKHLFKGAWPKLKVIDLSKKAINLDGSSLKNTSCKNITRGNMRELQKISLCKKLLI